MISHNTRAVSQMDYRQIAEGRDLISQHQIKDVLITSQNSNLPQVNVQKKVDQSSKFMVSRYASQSGIDDNYTTAQKSSFLDSLYKQSHGLYTPRKNDLQSIDGPTNEDLKSKLSIALPSKHSRQVKATAIQIQKAHKPDMSKTLHNFNFRKPLDRKPKNTDLTVEYDPSLEYNKRIQNFVCKTPNLTNEADTTRRRKVQHNLHVTGEIPPISKDRNQNSHLMTESGPLNQSKLAYQSSTARKHDK